MPIARSAESNRPNLAPNLTRRLPICSRHRQNKSHFADLMCWGNTRKNTTTRKVSGTNGTAGHFCDLRAQDETAHSPSVKTFLVKRGRARHCGWGETVWLLSFRAARPSLGGDGNFKTREGRCHLTTTRQNREPSFPLSIARCCSPTSCRCSRSFPSSGSRRSFRKNRDRSARPTTRGTHPRPPCG